MTQVSSTICQGHRMLDNAVAFTRKASFFDIPLRDIEAISGVHVLTAPTVDAVIAHLRSARVPTLFLDSRVEGYDSETQRLVEALESELTSINLVTVGGEFYPREIAPALDRMATCHLSLNAKGSIDVKELQLSSVLNSTQARPIPKMKRIEAGGIAFTTYTPEFFPVIQDLIRVAHREVTLLLVGETGTGKTTLARFIHHQSPRRDAPFQHLACGALPADLIESELFGHTRGAFTGADRSKIGRFQSAGRGTLLLDEIDVLDLKQQSKLLKVIETGEYELVGSAEPRQSEARLIVASNVNLDELIEKAQFRSDLYYRLNVLEFRLPPLRQRLLDIVPLAMDFVDECCTEHGIAVHRVHLQFLEALRKYRWPGNLRELKNHMRRAVLFCEGGTLTINDLSPKILQSQFAEEAPSVPQKDARTWTLADRVANSERELVEQALREQGYNRTRTAKALGLSRVGLYKKLRRLGLMDGV